MSRDATIPLLNRWYLAYADGDRRQRSDIPFNVFIHQFMSSDEPILHDHPWWFFTIILKGGYWEHLRDGSRVWRRPGSFRFNRGTFHWIEIPESGKTWSLFIRGRKTREWGFLENNVWVHWKEYLDKHRLV
jgi:hypothetical protein